MCAMETGLYEMELGGFQLLVLFMTNSVLESHFAA